MKIRPQEPSIDSTRHLSIQELTQRCLEIPHNRSGKLYHIVQRQADGSRKTPHSGYLCTEHGLVGDRWTTDPKKKKEEQIAVMDWHVASMIANGQSLTLFGDNLFMDWDFANIPIHTPFALGEARLEITPEPHTGCSKFAKRFGNDALTYTCLVPTNYVRGVYMRVLHPGRITIGDTLIPL